MDRSALVVQGLLLFFLIFGLLLAIVPENVNQFERAIYRALRLISSAAASRQLDERSILVNRALGVVCVVGSIIVLLNLQLQMGRLPDKPTPMWTDSALVSEAGGALLHRRISEIVQPAMDQHVGLMVVTIADDARDISGFGRVNLDSEQPPDGDTVFEIGSISKVFTGVLLADSIRKDRVTLETSMVSLLSEVSIDSKSRANQITLKHLVTHTSGLPRTPENIFDPVQFWRVITAGDPYRDRTDDSILQTISRVEPAFSPGERYAYSNLGFGVLGFILSGQSGMDYDQAVRTVIAQPLELRSTGVLLEQGQRSRLAAGYRIFLHAGPFYSAQRASPWEFPNTMAGAGGLRSTGNDMLTFLAANMGQRHSELTPALEQSHVVLYAKGGVQIGMGWFHDPLPKSGEMVVWHNGETGGYASYIGFTQDRRFGVVVLGNSTNNVDGLGREILDNLILKR